MNKGIAQPVSVSKSSNLLISLGIYGSAGMDGYLVPTKVYNTRIQYESRNFHSLSTL